MELFGRKYFFDPRTLGISLILALLVWIYVDDRRIEVKKVKVDLKLNIPEGWEAEGQIPTSFKVQLQGPKEQMKNLRFEHFKVIKSISPPLNHKSDVYATNISIQDSEIVVPGGMIVLSKNISEIHLSLLRLMPVFIPVVAKLEGEPAAGFRILRADCDPNYVEVLAPKGEVKFGDTLKTYPLNVSKQSSDFYQRVGIKPTRLSSGRILKSDKGIDVSVIIESVPVSKVLEKVPVKVLYGPLLGLRIMRITPPTIKLTVEGSKEAVARITEEAILIYCDISRITGEPRGNHKLRCRIQLPAGVIAKKLTPNNVTVLIK